MKFNNEYMPKITKIDDICIYYIEFLNGDNVYKEVEVSKEVFLQFFGRHKVKVINNKKHYFISYMDKNIKCEVEMTYKDYCTFSSFASYEQKASNIMSRYIEHSELDDYSLYKRLLHKPKSTEELAYESLFKEKVKNILLTLSDKQRRRFNYYFKDEMTYKEISHLENCSIQSVKESIDQVKKIIRKKII